MESDFMDGILTLEETASKINKNPRTLDRWHVARTGPPRIKLGKSVFYRADAVREWIMAREQDYKAK